MTHTHPNKVKALSLAIAARHWQQQPLIFWSQAAAIDGNDAKHMVVTRGVLMTKISVRLINVYNIQNFRNPK